ncbi:MAG: Integral membrane protein [Rhodobacteraceae bacterium HLUCCA12]|nr:MAG: Integral membrane protein [Rhodobacteraceae bacterium HLUCCA12]
MPYALDRITPTSARLRLWPHNTLAPRGFVVVIALVALALALPLLALVGTPALWGLLPFAGLAVWGLWYAIHRNWRDRAIIEEMQLSRSRVHLRHVGADGSVQEWQADPHWVTLSLIPKGGPVEQYLTLTGGGREVELGAFLTPPERVTLHQDLSDLLIALRSYA